MFIGGESMSPSVLTDLLNDATNILWERDDERLVRRWLRMQLHKRQVKDPDYSAGLLTSAAKHNNESTDIYFLVEKCICKS